MKFRPLGDRVLVRRVEEATKLLVASLFQTPLLKSRKKAKSLLLAMARSVMTMSAFRSTSKLATKSCSANGVAPR